MATSFGDVTYQDICGDCRFELSDRGVWFGQTEDVQHDLDACIHGTTVADWVSEEWDDIARDLPLEEFPDTDIMDVIERGFVSCRDEYVGSSDFWDWRPPGDVFIP